jgi:hypothetical protein
MQHQRLAEALGKADRKARIHYMPLIFGVGGSIFNSTTRHLTQLGVNGKTLRSLIGKIHLTAIEMLHWIYTTKLKKQRNKGGTWKRKRK